MDSMRTSYPYLNMLWCEGHPLRFMAPSHIIQVGLLRLGIAPFYLPALASTIRLNSPHGYSRAFLAIIIEGHTPYR